MSSEIISFETLMNNPTMGWPTFDDLRQGRVFIDNDFINDIEGILKQHQGFLIRGAEGRGKTVLARVIANRYKKKRKIRFIDVREIREEYIDNIFKQVEQAVENEKTLLIVENAHFSLDEISRRLVQFADNHPETFFIFTSREIFPEEEQPLDPFKEWKEKGWCVVLKPNLESAIRIIETFISAEKIDYHLTDIDKSWIEKEFGKEAINLRRLKWYLETWKGKGCPLASIKKSQVSEKVFDHYLRELAGNVNLNDMFYKVSGIFQFDVDFYGGGYDKAILSELERRGITTSRVGDFHGDYYRLQHSSDANYIIEALAARKKKNPEDITIDILKEYLQKRPANYSELMRALFQGKKKHSLSNIFGNQETYEAIFSKIKQDRIGRVGFVLSYLTWACGREKAIEFWTQYKKSWGDSPEKQKEQLKAKITEEFLVEVGFLLLFLSRVDVNEKDWFANEVLDENILSQKAIEKYPSFSTILNLVNLLPDERASIVISKLDPNILADKAKSSTSQKIMWFLKCCLRDPSNIKFAKSFLSAFNTGELIDKLKDSDLSTVKESLRIVKRLNSDLYKDIIETLSPYRLKIWFSSSLTEVAGRLCRYTKSKGEVREFGQSVVNNLASTDLSEPIKKLYTHPEARPLKTFGRLLDYANQIAFETDKDAVKRIAGQIVNNIDLKMKERFTIEQLSLLVRKVKKCNELAWAQLCNRIISELDLLDYISIPLDKGLAWLVWDIYQNDKEKGRELANKIISLDFDKVLGSTEAKTVGLLVWNLLQISGLTVKNWVKMTKGDKWLLKASSSSTYDAFGLLWSLYHANEEMAKCVTHLLAKDVLPRITMIEAKDLPLLGFFIFCNIKFDLNIPIQNSHEIAEKICEGQSLVGVAFSVFLLKNKNDKLLREFSRELARCLFVRDPKFAIEDAIEEMMKKYPFENTKQSLMEIYKDFNLPKEPNSTFGEMICLTKAYFIEKGKTEAAFSHLRDYFLNKPPDNPLFKAGDAATKWLNIGIEYEIYHKKQIPHHKDPSGTVTLLSLNKDNKIVSLHLKENEI